jgi:hypothetical protein
MENALQRSELWNRFLFLRSSLRYFFFRVIGLVLALFLFCSFSTAPYLEVRTEPLYPDYLAANQINTPDPCWDYFFGEQIVIYYKFPFSCRDSKNLALTIRYKNKEWEKRVFPLTRRKGYFIFRVVNDNYWKRGGLLSYKVELCAEGCVIKTWTHHLFVEKIEVNQEA